MSDYLNNVFQHIFSIAKLYCLTSFCSFQFPVAEDEYISQVAEGFIQFLKREVHRRTMPEMVNLIIWYSWCCLSFS